MSFIDALRYRLRVLLHPDSYGRALEDEVEHHLALEAMEQQSRTSEPLTNHAARQRAVRKFGNVTYANEERRIASGVALLDAARQDVQFVFRVLRRRRVFAAVTVATLALGVGAATAIFSIADIVLFRPLAFPHSERLITVWETRPELKTNPVRAGQWDRGGISLPTYRDWRATQTSFDDVAVWDFGSTIVGGSDAPEELQIIRASASLLPILGVRPELGRGFTEEEDAIGGAPVALIGHEAWVARLGRDPHVLGRRVRIDSISYSIIGVLPAGLTLDRSVAPAAYWVPVGANAEAARQPGWADFLTMARLKRGVSLATATAETERFIRTTPSNGSPNRGVRLTPLQDEQTRKVRQPILLLLAAAGLLLLIACANVATVVLGESANREAELRARMALGASRWRLVRQLLTESMVLAVIGGTLGAMLAYSGTKLIVRFAPPWIPGLADVRVDARVLAAALFVSCVTGLVFGIVPALSLSRSNDASGLRLGGHSGRRRGRSQRILVASEVALSMVLLVGAGLLVQSFERISAVDPGFPRDQLLIVRLRLPQPQYADTLRLRALYHALLDRARELPGVRSIAATTTPPFSGGSSSSSFDVEGRSVVRGTHGPEAQRRITTPGYFATAGIPIVDGRAYAETDRVDAPLVIVVSRSLAWREWPNESAVGKRIKWMGQWRTVVGVAGDVKLRDLFEDALATVYAPLDQLVRGSDPSLVIRMSGDVASTSAAMRAVIRDVAPDVPISRIDEMSSLVAATLSDQRFRTVLITLFAAIAALLAAVGMYGVAATAASRRTQEMAIRAALGASNGSIARLIVGAGAGGVALGALVGVGLALIGTRALTPYLYTVVHTDPATYASVLALLVVTTLAATWVPARRAMRVSLVDTLREG
ncbi:MAG TPA: ABC transporter permease [Gemmatimonadaceae bacterium]|nr:ABC transporter permease [Gemmatimonadaceae bacterium]